MYLHLDNNHNIKPDSHNCFHCQAQVHVQILTTVFIQICEECLPASQSARQLSAKEEQDEEGDTGEEAREEGSQDPLGHPAGVHPDLDSVQCPRRHEGYPWARAERGISLHFSLFIGSVRSSRNTIRLSVKLV